MKFDFLLFADWTSWTVVTLRSQKAHVCYKVSLGPTWPSDEQQAQFLILFFLFHGNRSVFLPNDFF